MLSPAHQFPTGVVLHPDRRAAAIAWAGAGGLIVEDDYDGELRYDRQPVGALQALAPERVVYGGTASKTLALCELLAAGAYERHVRRMRALARSSRSRAGDARRARARPRAGGDLSGLGVLIELPGSGPTAAQLVAEAADRSIELHALAPHYRDGDGPRDGVLIGYGAIPEHDFTAALSALGALLATTTDARGRDRCRPSGRARRVRRGRPR